MSRIFSRPMFKRGGSAGQGITSGLDRPGYAAGLDVQKVKELRDQTLGMYGQPPRGYGVYDFLTDWGLRMASATPKGNVLQTAASEAIEPHEKLMAGKSEAEMAEYLSGVKATDLAIGSLTDIAAAEAKNTLNKDFSVKRRVDTLSTQIRDKATPGTFGSTIQGSMGLALGQVYVTDLIQEKGANVNVGIIANENEEGDFSFDAGNLDMEKVWWDPKKQSWLVVTESVNDEGKPVAKKNYYTTFDEANKFHTQKKTIDSIDSSKTDSEDAGEIKSKDFTNIVKANEYKKIKSNKISMKITTDLTEVDVNDDAVIFDEAAKVGITIIPSPTTGRRAHDKTFHVSANEMTKYAFQKLLEKRQREQKHELLASVGMTNRQYIARHGLNKVFREYADEIKEKNNTQIVEKKAAGGLMRNIKNIDEESANELQKWWNSQGFTN